MCNTERHFIKLAALLAILPLLGVRAETTVEAHRTYDEPEIQAYIPYDQDSKQVQQRASLNRNVLNIFPNKSELRIQLFRLKHQSDENFETISKNKRIKS